ncbi:Pyridine nucleotide-disulfide oxidoreductase family protein [Staphylococcus microti]|uniref:Pyridine nucleotide-disulfide oxidoreductase family protein n=1 Tax=Staphylococcus microti TaxID=569857 RepID=A0A380I597_9STAP|nr:Pyridine nucleotide-disulfide oxidoreductase family protein [Staphylococcus microti]
MKKFDYIILGFGQGGKVFAKEEAQNGKKIAVVEKNALYGGTCINVGCIPSKVIALDSQHKLDFKDSIKRKNEVVAALKNKNYKNLDIEENITIFDNKAEFKSNNEINLLDDKGKLVDTIVGDKIIINTGASPIIPNADGLKQSKYVYDSTGIMNLDSLPKHLVIIGGGYISLEFASTFANFGAKVTVIEKADSLMLREDKEIVSHILEDLKKKNINFLTAREVESVEDDENSAYVRTNKETLETDAILVAIGRKPNTDLALENTDVELGERGEIKTNEFLETTAENVYALGDVKGGLQFTYVSKNDRFILRDAIYGKKQFSLKDRKSVPYTVFIDPPLSRVGLTAKEAKEKDLIY